MSKYEDHIWLPIGESRGYLFGDLCADHFDRRDRTEVANRLICRLEELGLKVKVEAAA